MTTPSQTETARPLDGAMENILDDGQRPGWWRHFAGHEDTECVIRPMHLASLLDRAARTHGNRLAIRFQNFQMTYSRLHEAAERFAEALPQASMDKAPVLEGRTMSILLIPKPNKD